MPIDATAMLTRNIVRAPEPVLSSLAPTARGKGSGEPFGAILERQVTQARPRDKAIAHERKPAERPRAKVAERESTREKIAEKPVEREAKAVDQSDRTDKTAKPAANDKTAKAEQPDKPEDAGQNKAAEANADEANADDANSNGADAQEAAPEDAQARNDSDGDAEAQTDDAEGEAPQLVMASDGANSIIDASAVATAALAVQSDELEAEQTDELELALKPGGANSSQKSETHEARADAIVDVEEMVEDDISDESESGDANDTAATEARELDAKRDGVDTAEVADKNIGQLVTKEIAANLGEVGTKDEPVKDAKAEPKTAAARKAAQAADPTKATQQVEEPEADAQAGEAEMHADSAELTERVQLSNMTRVRGPAQQNIDGLGRRDATQHLGPKVESGDSAREALEQHARDLQRARRQGAATQAVNRMTLRNGASGEIDLPQLGRVSVAARTMNGEVDVQLRAQDGTTLSVLQSVSAELERELRSNSVDLRDLDIDKEDDEQAKKRAAKQQDDEQDDEQEGAGDFDKPARNRQVRTLL